jgi:hypothetical protein
MNTGVKVLWILCVSLHQILVLDQYVADSVFGFAENCVPEVNLFHSSDLIFITNWKLICSQHIYFNKIHFLHDVFRTSDHETDVYTPS